MASGRTAAIGACHVMSPAHALLGRTGGHAPCSFEHATLDLDAKPRRACAAPRSSYRANDPGRRRRSAAACEAIPGSRSHHT